VSIEKLLGVSITNEALEKQKKKSKVVSEMTTVHISSMVQTTEYDPQDDCQGCCRPNGTGRGGGLGKVK
jgi:hypothetical protein